MTSPMDILVVANLVFPSVAQKADREYKDLVSLETSKIKMKNYTRERRFN